MKSIPNTISCLRIVLSVLLIFAYQRPMLFIFVYILCGISDVLDGFIARHYHTETILGAKLDSLADFIFWGIVFYVLLHFLHVKISISISLTASIIVLIRVINFIVTKGKYKQWSMMHTIGNKVTGIILFLICPVWLLAGTVPFVVTIIPLLSAIEESIILFTGKSYDINRKCIFGRSTNG